MKIDVMKISDVEYQGILTDEDGTRTVTTIHKTWHRAWLSIANEAKRRLAKKFIAE